MGLWSMAQGVLQHSSGSVGSWGSFGIVLLTVLLERVVPCSAGVFGGSLSQIHNVPDTV